MAAKAVRKGAAAAAAARAAAVVAKASIARGGDAARSDCLIEVADLEQVLSGPETSTWPAKVKVTLQQVFRRFGPVLDVRVPTGETHPIVSVRFANAKSSEAAMVAASQGFLPIAESGFVRLRQPTSKEAIWRSFPAKRPAPGLVEPKKKKLRPNERFAPPRMPVEMVEDTELPKAAAAEPKAPPAPKAAPEVPLPQIPAEPPRPEPFEAGAEASEEDLQVAEGEAKVAEDMAALLEQPFSKQKKATNSWLLDYMIHGQRRYLWEDNGINATKAYKLIDEFVQLLKKAHKAFKALAPEKDIVLTTFDALAKELEGLQRKTQKG